MINVLCIKNSGQFKKDQWYLLSSNYYIKQKDDTYKRSIYSVYTDKSNIYNTTHVNFNEIEFNETFIAKEQIRENRLNSILG